MHPRGERSDKNHGIVVKRLREVMKCLSECCGAEEIVLFGSYARGDHKRYSSMDILVIAKTELPFVERILRALDCIPEAEIGVEVLVYTPEEITQKIEEGESFVVSAMNEGVLIWRKGTEIDLETQLKKAKTQSAYRELLREIE